MFGDVLENTLFQSLVFIGAVFIVGFIISQINKLFYRSIGGGMGMVYATGVIGTPIHELSHALMCIIFRHRILEIKLFQIDPETGVLGYVNHSYNPKSIYQRTGNFFIGTAPILFGTLFLLLMLRLLTPLSFAFVSQEIGALSAMMEMGEGFNFGGVFTIFGKLLQGVFTVDFSFRTIIFILICFCIALHMNLSGADIKGSLTGVPMVILVLFLMNFIIRLFGEGGYISFLSGMNFVMCYYASFLLLSLVFSCLILALGLLIKVLKGVFGRR